jgi:hypothetical protein
MTRWEVAETLFGAGFLALWLVFAAIVLRAMRAGLRRPDLVFTFDLGKRSVALNAVLLETGAWLRVLNGLAILGTGLMLAAGGAALWAVMGDRG